MKGTEVARSKLTTETIGDRASASDSGVFVATKSTQGKFLKYSTVVRVNDVREAVANANAALAGRIGMGTSTTGE